MRDWTSRLFRPRDPYDAQLEALDPELEEELLAVGVEDTGRPLAAALDRHRYQALRQHHDAFRRTSQRRVRRQVSRP